MKSRQTNKLPSWQLNDLYKGISDPGVKRDLKKARNLAQSFKKRYAGKINRNAIKASDFLKMLKRYEDLHLILYKPLHFASLLFADSATEAGRGAFMQGVQSEVVEIRNLLAFVVPELLALSAGTLTRLLKNKELKEYQNFLKNLIESRPHQLPEKERQIFSDLSLTGNSAFSRLFEEEFATKSYVVFLKKKAQKMTITTTLDLLHSNDQKIRKAAHQGFSTGLKEESRRLTYIFNTLLQDKRIRDKHHNFKRPEDERHLDNQIDKSAVEQLVKVARSSFTEVARYYKLKARLLGVEKLYDFDRYAPVFGKEAKTPFKTAQENINEAFKDFHPEFGRISNEFFVKNWVDAADRPGKRGGAFCSFCTPDHHPYVFMNYSGTSRDVFTLAHELGHGIHAYLMRKQSYLNFDTPLTIAETASVFAELLLFKKLVDKAKSNQQRLRLYLRHIENIIATVHRQISMFLFERDLHDLSAKLGELSTEQISVLWRKRQEEMFKGSVILTPEYDLWWSYIPHFIHTPFYVYAYSYGQLLALGFFEHYQNSPDDFAKKYIDFLSAGNIISQSELLRPFKVNLSKEDIWRDGVKVLKTMISEAEKLAEETV